MERTLRVLALLSSVAVLQAQYYEGDSCSLPTGAGTCLSFGKCASALEMIRKGQSPQTCSFSGREPIVCCPGGGGSKPALTPAPPPRTTTPYVPTVADYVDEVKSECPPIPHRTGTKTGRKAWDKCIEYQELIFPCESSRGLAADEDLVRGNYCYHQAVELIIGGVDTQENEFPHMAMLGYGPDVQNLGWLCGGTLISEHFVVTAGHCTFSREFGNVTYVRLGALRRSQPVDLRRTYPVSEIIKHPLYKPPGKYNDIALLRMAQRMILDKFAVPACLDFGEAPAADKALATGWGSVQYKGANADVLQKVVLEKFTTPECRAKFPPGERNMRDGYQESSQICYGHHTESRDTCQGDSGGPLQTYNFRVHCMYWLIGVTSFGKACGFAGNPGVYTRVAQYSQWIESVVWP